MDIVSWQILKRDIEYFIHPDGSGGRSVASTPFTAWADYQAGLGDHPVIKNQSRLLGGEQQRGGSGFSIQAQPAVTGSLCQQ